MLICSHDCQHKSSFICLNSHISTPQRNPLCSPAPTVPPHHFPSLPPRLLPLLSIESSTRLVAGSSASFSSQLHLRSQLQLRLHLDLRLFGGHHLCYYFITCYGATATTTWMMMIMWLWWAPNCVDFLLLVRPITTTAAAAVEAAITCNMRTASCSNIY